MTTTLARLNDIFQDVFDDDELRITRETNAADVPGWDSLTHVTLLLNVEKRFGLRFSSAQVASLNSVGDLVDLIERTARR